jgi:glutathione S-transferase
MSDTTKIGVAAIVGAGLGFAVGAILMKGRKRVTSLKKPLELHTNKICPFAQRAWITLLEKKLPFDTIKVPLTGEMNKMKAVGNTKGTQWSDYTVDEVFEMKKKYKENINSTGEVPTVVDTDGTIVPESDVVSWYLDDKYPEYGTRLLPGDPVKMAKLNTMMKIIPGTIGNLYGLLRNQDPSKDDEMIDSIHAKLTKVISLADKKGPYLLGSEISYVDIMFMPFYDRFRNLLPHYRNRELFPGKEAGIRWQKWADAVTERDSFKKTSQPKEFLIASYAGYAGDRGRSQ